MKRTDFSPGMLVSPIKDLVNDAGKQDFTKGQQYRMLNSSSDAVPRTLDDEGALHELGVWRKHFKNVP